MKLHVLLWGFIDAKVRTCASIVNRQLELGNIIVEKISTVLLSMILRGDCQSPLIQYSLAF
ncbi:hypothetical protein Pint_06828 [Pistacia integerrima]|uniref:Uncharacterized protein n=1 Tax=Pistacia integerrima TaxID=434235 RepID=A0ACC0XU45_9ROSI|nr:hypothetical protein Pint_06828 [Pistacia integerrima]